MGTLPRTFIDAIAVARTLSVQYLWIGSLAIIQISPKDRAYEASCIDQVHQNSICNIGATATVDSFDGLLHQRDPDLVKPGRIRPDGEVYQINWS
jgi:hypothetical protein